MHQRTRRLAIVFAGSLLATIGALAACSTDNGTTPTPGAGTPDSGKKDAAKADGSDTDPDTDGDAGDGGKKPGTCTNQPTVKSSVGPYCLGVPDGGPDGGSGGVNCDSSKHEICCSDGTLPGDAGGYAPSECKVAAVSSEGYADSPATCESTFTGTGGKEYHCTEADHCPGDGEFCCAYPAPPTTTLTPGHNKDFDDSCKAYYQSGKYVGGTRCQKTGCGMGELTLCSKDEDCKAGTCVPLSIEGRYTGYCRL